jgi:hypothetical protein
MERNVYVFTKVPQGNFDEAKMLTIVEFDDMFELHVSTDPMAQPEIFDFDGDADENDRYRMVSQLISIYLTTPELQEGE